jgi:superfamily II DNA or RNA helicase
MDWNRVLKRLDKPRLQHAIEKLGQDPGRDNRAVLRARVVTLLVDRHAKLSVLDLLTVAELREVAKQLEVRYGLRRKADLIEELVAADEEAALDETAARDVDAGRPDVTSLEPEPTPFQLVPTHPTSSGTTLFTEISDLIMRRRIHRMVFVSYVCQTQTLVQLTGARFDDFLEVVLTHAEGRERRDTDPPRVTLILDREKHQLDSPLGRKLTALAYEQPDRFEIRLGPLDRRLHAKIYLFEEFFEDGPFLTGYVGSANLTQPGLGGPSVTPNIEASVRIAGFLEDDDSESLDQLRRWVEQLEAVSQPLSLEKLESIGLDDDVRHKVRYKARFDTAHELRLKHLAEHLTRRGRHTWPRCDVAHVHPPPDHQLVPVVRSAMDDERGFLLLDEVGLGKSVETGLILSRELRRRRYRPEASRPRALLLAPSAIHEQWREELRTKFHLEAEVIASGAEASAHWEESHADVLIASPDLARNREAEVPEFDVLVVDEFHRARGNVTHDALKRIADRCHRVLLASGTPIQNRLDELRKTFELVDADLDFAGDDTFRRLFGVGDTPDELVALRDLMRPMASRSFRRKLLGFGEGRIPPRRVENVSYDLTPAAAASYDALRALANRYREIHGGRAGWALLTLEQMFLSSPHAFLQLAGNITGDRFAPPDVDDEDDSLSQLRQRDDSYAFLRESRRQREALQDAVASVRNEAELAGSVSAKEQAFLKLLRGQAGRRVLVFTRFVATQARLASVLRRVGLDYERARELNGRTPRHERAARLEWFLRDDLRERDDLPAKVLVCTDVAAEGLNLQAGCSVLINYDLPWNPQRIEQRIGRLQRWGQSAEVLVFNLQARNPLAANGWTMDTRVVEVCEQKFGLADATVGASEALLGLKPLEVEEALARGAEIESEPPVTRDLASLDALFPGEDATEHAAAIALARTQFARYRDLAEEFWQRVTHEGTSLGNAQAAFADRLHRAQMQGQVALLRDARTPLDRATKVSAFVGTRLIVESVELDDEEASHEDAHPDAWFVEDEIVQLWHVGTGEPITDGSSRLMAGGLLEVLAEEVALHGMLDDAILEFLEGHKDHVEARRLDGVPLREVLDREPPPAIRAYLEAVARHTELLAAERTQQLRRDIDEASARRRGRFERLIEHAQSRVPKRTLASLQRIVDAPPRRVELVPEIRLTQLALVFE